MKKPPLFLTPEHVCAIQRRMLAEFGGRPGLRDRNLLESAADMPRAGFGGQYLHQGVPAMAAAYLFHLCKNHPFVDGNKRTALAAAEVFLLLNNHRLTAANAELTSVTFGVADGSLSKRELTVFFEKPVRRLPIGD